MKMMRAFIRKIFINFRFILRNNLRESYQNKIIHSKKFICLKILTYHMDKTIRRCSQDNKRLTQYKTFKFIILRINNKANKCIKIK